MPPLPSAPTSSDYAAVVVDVDGVINLIEKGKPAPPDLDESLESGTVESTPPTEGPSASAEMTVMGIYKRGEVPREDELPEDYALKDCAQDQIMVRQRLNTRPLLDDDSDDDSDEDEADSEDGGDADDESDGGARSSAASSSAGSRGRRRTKSRRSDKDRTKRSLLRRLSPKKYQDGKDGEYDVAMFKPEEGLVMDKGDWPFYHADLSEHSDSSDDERVSRILVLVDLPASQS